VRKINVIILGPTGPRIAGSPGSVVASSLVAFLVEFGDVSSTLFW